VTLLVQLELRCKSDEKVGAQLKKKKLKNLYQCIQ